MLAVRLLWELVVSNGNSLVLCVVDRRLAGNGTEGRGMARGPCLDHSKLAQVLP